MPLRVCHFASDTAISEKDLCGNMEPVSSEPKRPLYMQIHDLLESQIASGKWPVGELLPPETELAKNFNVSRATVRSAILKLVDAGLLKRTSGVGTVVLRTQPKPIASYFRGFANRLQQQGISTKIIMIATEEVVPPVSIAHRLQLHEGETAYSIKRIRTVSGTPFALLHSYIPKLPTPTSELGRIDALYSTLEEKGGIYVTEINELIGARLADGESAEHLQVKAGFPLISIRTTAYTDRGRPVEAGLSLVRSDLFEYEVTLPREVR